MSEENKALMHWFYEEWVHTGNLEVADEIIAPDCLPYFGGMFMGAGPEALKQTRAMMYSGFPDLRWTINEIIAEGETVAERLTGRGTHQGKDPNGAKLVSEGPGSGAGLSSFPTFCRCFRSAPGRIRTSDSRFRKLNRSVYRGSPRLEIRLPKPF